MNEKEYSDKWFVSSCSFYENKIYEWMSNHIHRYKTILEIGCGNGFSTLTLLKRGHYVIAIEKNAECIKKTNGLLKKEGFNDGYELIHADLMNAHDLIGRLKIKNIDAVVCWNPGIGHIDKELFGNYCRHMIEYGLTFEQIKNNPENSYVEWMIYESASMAQKLNCPFCLIDRVGEDCSVKIPDFYLALKNELGFESIESICLKTRSVSSNGIMLVNNGKSIDAENVDIYLASLMFF